MRIVVAGAAGLIGSHLVDALLERGDRVLAIDNLVTGRMENLADATAHPGFSFRHCDISDIVEPDGPDTEGPVDAVVNLASPASPVDFGIRPLEILRAGGPGTIATLDLARRHDARYLLASTSEVYGEPAVHPQPESYWGNVNPIGPRACYDESKRYAEALVSTSRRALDMDTAIARIFNTYGPRMRIDDGRVVSNFVVQALRGDPLTVHGDGLQTRSFCHVDDQVRGLLALLDSDHAGPINIGNPTEMTVLDLARTVIELTGSRSHVKHDPLPQDDPTHRRPDITVARELLGFEPRIGLHEGLGSVIRYFTGTLSAESGQRSRR